MGYPIEKTGNILAMELQHLAIFLENMGYPIAELTLKEVFKLRHNIIKAIDSSDLKQNLDNIKNPY